MTTAIEQFYRTLTPERLEAYKFRSPAHFYARKRIFGGQMLAQALSVVARTVADDRCAHSLHAYFLRAADNRNPVVFDVEPLRDGGSFSTRQVVAKQEGKAIFSASVSFKVAGEGVCHQPEAPDFPAPVHLPNDLERRKIHGLSDAYAEPDPFSVFDFRTVGQLPDEYKVGDSDRQGFWVKTVAPALGSVVMQQCLLAYLSDVRLLLTAMKPHGLKFWDQSLQAASLDHAIWFHRPFGFDEWLYYDMAGPVSSDGRGLNFGRFYDGSGNLVASTAQEGLMRLR